MSLVPGARLGPYEIVSPLGAGGMGEVYRARDTRLDRNVAIKVLPGEVAQDVERRARFEREAKAVSSLNHPHICTLHDIGRQDALDYLVMELVEGQTLLEGLAKGPLPTDQALRYGIEIADALSQAHRHGVVHRDLKPGNIMLTKTGVKLLDFGLAKTYSSGDQSVASQLSTGTGPLTQEGAVLGTSQYMAPEQLEGKEADARSDLWALGCVLFEMATGRPAFSSQSHASLIAAILNSEPPPITSVQPLAPSGLDRLVRKCLAKDPDNRWDTAHDVADELRWVAETAPSPSTAAMTAPRRREWVAWTLVGGLGLALLGLGATLALRPPQREPRVVRFNLTGPEGTELQPHLAVSPDGRRLAFTSKGEDGLDRLYLRALDSTSSQAIVGSDGALQPFWSPDGRSIGFFAQGKLKRAEIDGGAPQTICSIPELRGATWNGNGIILFGTGGAYGLSRVAATGGVPEPVTTLDTRLGETSHRWPCFLPDGRHFLYLVLRGANASIAVGSLDGSKPVPLIDAFSAPTFAASGHILFVRDDTLRAQRFDVDALRLIGEPLTLAEPVQVDMNLWGGTPVSTGGDILVYRRGHIGTVRLTWFDREGRELGSVGPPGDYHDLSLSPDGGTLLVSNESHLTLVDLGTGAFRRLTFKPELATRSSWSPDGRSIAYDSTRNGPFSLFIVPANGSGTEDAVTGTGDARNPVFSPDGRLVLYESSNDPTTRYDLWVLPLVGDRTPHPFLRTQDNEAHAWLSPNGRWIAYTADGTGRSEVYVRAFPSGEGPWQISTEGGDQAQWRRDGRELFYVSPARRIMVVAVNGDGTAFRASPPKALFRARMRAPGIVSVRNDYVVRADGQRFLINKLVEDPAKGTITTVVNWVSKLPR